MSFPELETNPAIKCLCDTSVSFFTQTNTTPSKAMSSYAWAPQCHVGQHHSVIFQMTRLILLKPLKCVQLIGQILLFRVDSHQDWESSTKIQETEGLWLCSSWERFIRRHSSSSFWTNISCDFSNDFQIPWGTKFNMQQAHWAQLLHFPPITLCNSLICNIPTYNSRNSYFSSSCLQVPFKMILPSVMLLQSQSGDL